MIMCKCRYFSRVLTLACNSSLTLPKYCNTTTMRTISLLLALLLIGCSTERQCARAAKRCAHLWHSDTAWVFDSLRFPPRSVRAVFNLNQVMNRDTLIFQNGRAMFRFWRVGNDSAAADCDCPDTVFVYPKAIITNKPQIEQPRPWWYWWPVWVLGFIALRQFAVWALRKL